MTPPRSDRPAVLFAHLVVTACCLSAGWLISTQGVSRLPNKDEYGSLAQYARLDCDLREWAFAHHVEHRYPLAKVLWLGAVRASGWNFRAPMYVILGLLTAAAVMLVWTARGWRGRQSWADAVIPVALLHWGHSHNMLFGFQINFALVVYGVAGWVWAAGRPAPGGGGGGPAPPSLIP